MSFRGHIEDFFFFHEIGVNELDENKAKRNQSKPDGPAGKHRAQKCGEHAAGHKDAQHADMQPRPLGERLVFRMLEGFDDMNAKLADVVGAKGRRHRNAPRLAKRVVLHRAQHHSFVLPSTCWNCKSCKRYLEKLIVNLIWKH